MEISKKNIMSQGSLNPKIRSRSLGQKVCSVARVQMDRQTVNIEDTLSGFQDFFLQPMHHQGSLQYGIHFNSIFVILISMLNVSCVRKVKGHRTLIYHFDVI